MAGPGPLQRISPNEQQLVERAIGSAVLNKLRGNPSSLIGAYQALGGGDPTTISALGAVDQSFQSWDLSEAERAAAAVAPAGSFAQAYDRWGIDSAELTLIQRTIGGAYLRRLQGQSASYSDVYASLGGGNPHTRRVFQELDPIWERVNVGPTVAVLEAV